MYFVPPKNNILKDQILPSNFFPSSRSSPLGDTCLYNVCFVIPSSSHKLPILVSAFPIAAIAASYHAGVDIEKAAKSLAEFKPVKRRLGLRGKLRGISVYDDFAHHPTAIQKTLNALKESKRHQRIFDVLEFASYTMKTGVHANSMAEALAKVDKAYVLNPSEFDLQSQLNQWPCPYAIYPNTELIVAALGQELKENDAVLIMSNRGFANIHQTLLNSIETIT